MPRWRISTSRSSCHSSSGSLHGKVSSPAASSAGGLNTKRTAVRSPVAGLRCRPSAKGGAGWEGLRADSSSRLYLDTVRVRARVGLSAGQLDARACSVSRVATYDDDLRFAHVLADAADDITTKRFRALDLRVDTKPDLTPVTDADRATEESLRNILRRSRPRDAVLGEESGQTGIGCGAGCSTRSTPRRTTSVAFPSGPRLSG